MRGVTRNSHIIPHGCTNSLHITVLSLFFLIHSFPLPPPPLCPSLSSSSFSSCAYSSTRAIPGDSLAFITLLTADSWAVPINYHPFFVQSSTYLASAATVFTELAYQTWPLSAPCSIREESNKRYHQKRTSDGLIPNPKQWAIPFHHRYLRG